MGREGQAGGNPAEEAGSGTYRGKKAAFLGLGKFQKENKPFPHSAASKMPQALLVPC